MSKKLVKIAFIRKPHGLAGEVSVSSLTDFPDERFIDGSKFILDGFEEEREPLVLEKSRPHKSDFLMKFNDLDTIEDVEHLRGLYLCIEQEERIELSSDDFYEDQLVGMEVFDQDEVYVGKVYNIQVHPAQSHLQIKKETKKIDIPFVKAMIKRIDVAEKKIYLSEGYSAY
ncbi:ribosome maturation factor RimM [bacterium]|nr:ribosome maturation factor RimM [bacterium]